MKETVGARIKFYRERMNFSQSELGSAMGAHKQTIAGWEAGRSWPEYPKLQALAKHLGVDPSNFFETIKPPLPTTVEELTKVIESQERRIRDLERHARQTQPEPQEAPQGMPEEIRELVRLGPYLNDGQLMTLKAVLTGLKRDPKLARLTADEKNK